MGLPHVRRASSDFIEDRALIIEDKNIFGIIAENPGLTSHHSEHAGLLHPRRIGLRRVLEDDPIELAVSDPEGEKFTGRELGNE